MIVRLIYTSRPARALAMHEVEDILQISKRNNTANHISGMLVYGDHFFLQCLEGPRNEVNETYLRICRDDRHQDCILLRYEQVECRIFGQWAMGRIQYKASASLLAMKYSAHGILDPYAMSSVQAEMFMKELGDIAKAAAEKKKLTRSLSSSGTQAK